MTVSFQPHPVKVGEIITFPPIRTKSSRPKKGCLSNQPCSTAHQKTLPITRKSISSTQTESGQTIEQKFKQNPNPLTSSSQQPIPQETNSNYRHRHNRHLRRLPNPLRRPGRHPLGIQPLPLIIHRRDLDASEPRFGPANPLRVLQIPPGR